MTQQLPLDLPRRLALGREDFFVAPANALALAAIDDFANWSAGRMVLCGPAGAGKTHLAHVWAQVSGAAILPARDLPQADLPALAQAPLCVEDAPQIAGQPTGERALFHMLNLAREARMPVMMTARAPVPDWGLTLPDLLSRVQAGATARLDPPDDGLLAAVLVKLFAERHSLPAPDVVPYLLRHMPRSFDAARRVVAEIDRRAMATRRGATRAKAREALRAIVDDLPDGAD